MWCLLPMAKPGGFVLHSLSPELRHYFPFLHCRLHSLHFISIFLLAIAIFISIITPSPPSSVMTSLPIGKPVLSLHPYHCIPHHCLHHLHLYHLHLHHHQVGDEPNLPTQHTVHARVVKFLPWIVPIVFAKSSCGPSPGDDYYSDSSTPVTEY